MVNNIKTFVSSCCECFAKLSSQVSNPVVTEPPSSSFFPPFASAVQSCMSSYSYCPGIIATTTTTRTPSQPSAPLPGIRACLTSAPQVLPSVSNVDTRGTQDFWLGCNFSNSQHSITTPPLRSTTPLRPSMSFPFPNRRTGPESGRFLELHPDPGFLTPMNNSNAVTNVRVPRQLPFIPECPPSPPNPS